MMLGLLAVVAFSLTIPMTRLAVPYLGVEFVSVGRTALAGLIALAVLLGRREHFPRAHIKGLLLTSLSAMLGYPVLTAIALTHVPAAHGAVIIGFMPALTALFAVVRGGERPTASFWLACMLGAISVAGFAVVKGAGHVSAADGLLVLAAVICSYGYTEGAITAKAIGGWRVVFWGQALILPLTIPAFAWAYAHTHMAPHIPLMAWLAFADLVGISALVGFLIWYMGLALGGVARVGQLQLLQLPLSCMWSALLLGERLDAATLIAALAVVASAGVTVVSRQRPLRITLSRPVVSLGSAR
jgi:drug/metabolite transporter (DMT)-like permease